MFVFLPETRSTRSAYTLALIMCGGVIGVLAYGGFSGIFNQLSTDDAMRLVQVRDLLNGQGWFDLVQRRLDMPNATPMHWSRLVDLPLAAVMAVLELFFTRETAEALTLTFWPLLLIIPTVLGMLHIARVLIGVEVQKFVFLFCFSIALIMGNYFKPGAIDHHNIQIMLIVWMLAGLLSMGGKTSGSAICAGLCAAVSLAVGPETMPLVLAGCGAAVLFWLYSSSPQTLEHTRAFGLTFGLGTAALFFMTVPPDTYSTVWCDALTLPQMLAALSGGIGLAVLTFVRFESRVFKILAIATVGLAALGIALLVAPQCFAKPLATLPLDVKTLWLQNVREAQNITQVIYKDLALLLFVYVLPGLALLLTVFFCFKAAPEKRLGWMQFLLLFVAAFGITLWQIRGSMTSSALALVPLAAVVRMLGKPCCTSDWGWLTAKSLLFALVFNGVTFAFAGKGLEAFVFEKTKASEQQFEEKQGYTKLCTERQSYLPLRNMPDAFFANPIDSGPFLLAWTNHAVLAAPYHRQTRGLSDVIALFRATPDEAENTVRERGITHILWCANDGQNWIYTHNASNGLLAQLIHGHIPAWLEPVPMPHTPFKVYRVLPVSRSLHTRY